MILKITKLSLLFLIWGLCGSLAYSIDTLKSVESKVVLEENDTLMIKNAIFTSLSPNGKILALIDKTSSYFSLYNTETGKLINCYVSDYTQNNVLMNKKDYWKDYAFPNFNIIDNHTADSLGLNVDNIRNIVENVRFLDDTTVLVGMTVRAYAINENFSKSNPRPDANVMMNNAAYFIFDKNLKIITSSPFHSLNEYIGPVVWVLCPYENNKYIVDMPNFKDWSNGTDSLTAFSLYDSDGKMIRVMCYMPEEYSHDSIGYSCFYKPLMCKEKNNYYWTCIGDFRIRNLFDSTLSFAIQGFDTTNYDRIQSFVKQRRTDRSKAKVLKLCQQILNLEPWTDESLAVGMMYKRSFHIQFYNTQGKLLGHYILKPSDDLVLQSIAFYPELSRIYAVVKDTENYYLTYFEIPKIEDK